jgi:hypothetical protein
MPSGWAAAVDSGWRPGSPGSIRWRIAVSHHEKGMKKDDKKPADKKVAPKK